MRNWKRLVAAQVVAVMCLLGVTAGCDQASQNWAKQFTTAQGLFVIDSFLPIAIDLLQKFDVVAMEDVSRTKTQLTTLRTVVDSLIRAIDTANADNTRIVADTPPGATANGGTTGSSVRNYTVVTLK